MRNFYFFTFVFFFSLLSTTNAQHIISGKVVDKDSNALEWTNVSLLQASDSSLVTGTISDSEGKFQLNAASGNYIMKVSFIGYTTFQKPFTIKQNISLQKEIILEEDKKNLETVVVKGQKNLIERKADRIVFNVENSPSTAGSSGWEALRKAPGVMTDQNGEVAISGKKGARVMINDRIVQLSGDELKAYIEGLSADDISSIEVITAPPAKYDAEGAAGLINIKTKSTPAFGLVGSLRSGLEQASLFGYNGGINFYYQDQKINIYGQYGGKSSGFTGVNDGTTTIYDATTYIADHYKYRNLTHNFKGGLDYKLNNKNVIGLMAESSSRKGKGDISSITTFDNQEDNLFENPSNTDSKRQLYSLNLNYRRDFSTEGHSLSTDLDYTTYQSNSLQEIYDFQKESKLESTGNGMKHFLSESLSDQDFTIQSAKIDYNLPIKNLSLESGAKISRVKVKSDAEFKDNLNGALAKDPTKSNLFHYQETISALYTGINSSIKEKFDVKLGLRGEYTQIEQNSQGSLDSTNQNNYLSFFPSVFLLYKDTDRQQWKLSYNKRIRRPSYRSLNPFRYYKNPYTYAEGNPYLQPSTVHNLELGYTLDQTYTISAYYQYNLNDATDMAFQEPQDEYLYYSYINLPPSKRYGMNFYIPITFTSWWSINNSLNLYAVKENFTYLNQYISNHQLSANLSSTNTFSISNGIKIELSSWYNSPQRSFIYKVGNTFDVSLGVKKSLFNDRGSLALNLSDIFKGNVAEVDINLEQMKAEYRNQFDTRYLRLSFNYKFGKESVKNNRKRKAGNQEERNRL
ncbi:TonB-dependent receptor domain-containing protein [Xanthovirga aplysinae]|uniref:TonB-dependent receptor domain-containing protein n=1 Tax=Xanthovirga aplysinae TaxID=2529853 RepID=UPI0012BC7AFE|nr:TonB-dependent receptor [Xanthovirga aplysinae]MTI33169.1 TonB-dependent receptor [Xanthovirga aplysinae]